MLADQSYGLRFDIYERVHLSEDVTGIDELEEIELFPKIQVIPGEEYASLRGHLLLSGLYRGGGSAQELEHWIPVEITIPLSRIGRLEDISVEIENFDVDLLSARSLNITGVLSLQGIETSSLVSETDEWKDREFVTAHEPAANLPGQGEVREAADWGDESDNGAVQYNYTEHFRAWEQAAQRELPGADEQQPLLTWNDQTSPLFAQPAVTDKDTEGLATEQWKARDPELTDEDATENGGPERTWNAEQAEWLDDEEQPATNVSAAYFEEFEEPENAGMDRESEMAVPVSEDDSLSLEPEVSVPVSADFGSAQEVLAGELEPDAEIRPEPEEKKELKIALGSKKSGDSAQDNQFGSISKMLSTHRPDSLPAPDIQEEDTAPIIGEQGDGEEVRWKSLFIGNTEDQAPFRKVKLVIVQREETLDEIAERYQLSSRELQLYNRLSEHHLAEGQVLYIP